MDFWQLILDHIDDDIRKLAMEIFGDDVAELIALPLDVLKARMANYMPHTMTGRELTDFVMKPVARGDGSMNYVGQFAPLPSRPALQPKTHRDRMRALVTKLLAEAPKLEDAAPDDIGAIDCQIILKGGYQARGALKPSDDGEMLRFLTIGKVNTERGVKVVSMEHHFDFDDLMAVIIPTAMADEGGGLFGG